ncbi:MAG: DUF4143 domain-containing protein [Propionibacteriaceae bacterium]|jgi:predicted AAA+ superfamily ATPase|nr:DUF4143 domain-containing protein [Propionibacteriaceae bacterium]
MSYRPRVLDPVVEEHLQAMGGVLLEGPRGCGKTATGLEHAASSLRLDASPRLVELASLDPQSLLAGETPRLIDEWQLAPALWNHARHEIDDRQAPGQFLFSGSASPPPDPSRHSGAGRISRLRLHTMSLAETGLSSGAVSLESLHQGQSKVSGASDVTYERLAEQAVRGGWPGLLESSQQAAARFNRSYVQDVSSAAITAPEGTRHDPVRLRRLLSALARNVSGQATLRSLAADVGGSEPSISPDTVRSYMDSLTRTFCLDELPAWGVKLRSRSRLRTPAKLHFCDPALAVAALGVDARRLAHDPEFFGHVFESMVVHDLRVYAQAHDAQVFHYRDNTGLEVDAIIDYSWNDWAAVEVKLGWSQTEAAERNLLALRDERVDTDVAGKPAFLAVVTGAEYAYTLPSGVHVIPLTLLGP